MIGVEEAVRAALATLPRALGGSRVLESVRVEEVIPPERDDDPWQVTVSYLEPGIEPPQSPVEQFMNRGPGKRPAAKERVLRVVSIKSNGEFAGMRLRPTG